MLPGLDGSANGIYIVIASYGIPGCSNMFQTFMTAVEGVLFSQI